MRLSEFDYELPAERVAQYPASPRDSARLLVLDRMSGDRSHRVFRELPGLLRPSDLLVWNETSVIPARLRASREGTGGQVELLLLERLRVRPGEPESWNALFSASRAPRPGTRVRLPGGGLAEVLCRESGPVHRIGVLSGEPLEAVLDRYGEVPLPPYIRRNGEPGEEDRERYQTIYARVKGAVAAPTAGLHFTEGVLGALSERGIERRALVLHVGYGTFAPVKTEDFRAHRMHEEIYTIPEDTARAVTEALQRGRRVVAVGTTTLRALEAAAGRAAEQDAPDSSPVRIAPGTARTDLFITPGYRFRTATALLTNFHLPRSTLLLLVCAFAGRDRILDAYGEAVQRGYRFYSYGDAMLIL